MPPYGITADELDKEILEAVTRYCAHFSLGAEHILEGSEGRPLHQTINMVINHVWLLGKEQGREQEKRSHLAAQVAMDETKGEGDRTSQTDDSTGSE